MYWRNLLTPGDVHHRYPMNHHNIMKFVHECVVWANFYFTVLNYTYARDLSIKLDQVNRNIKRRKFTT